MPGKGAPETGAETSREQMKPIEDPVGSALKRLHDEVVAEPLPEDFLRLLGDIERKIAGQTGGE